MGWKQELKLKDQLNFFLILEFCCKMFLYKFIHQAESACNEQHRQMLLAIFLWLIEKQAGAELGHAQGLV